MFPSSGSDGWASLHIAFLGSWVGWVGRGQEAGLALGSFHISFLGSWVGWVGRGQEAGLPLGSLHVSFFRGPGSDGWAAEKLGSHWTHWTPFIFPFCAPGSDGWSAAKKLGSRWAPFMFPSFWAPGSDGWAAAKKLGSHWAPFIFPFWAPGSDGRDQEAGLSLGCLHVSFLLGSWVGWVGRGQEAGLALKGLGSWADGWAAAKSWAPFMFPFRRVGSDGWAAAKGLGARHVSFLGPWVRSCSRLGWMGRAHKAGLHCFLFVAKAAPIGWAAANELGSHHWAPFMFPFWVPGSDGWAAAKNLGFVGLPSCFLLSGSCVGWVGRGKEAGLPLGSLHISFLGSWVG